MLSLAVQHPLFFPEHLCQWGTDRVEDLVWKEWGGNLFVQRFKRKRRRLETDLRIKEIERGTIMAILQRPVSLKSPPPWLSPSCRDMRWLLLLRAIPYTPIISFSSTPVTVGLVLFPHTHIHALSIHLQHEFPLSLTVYVLVFFGSSISDSKQASSE